MNIVRTGVIVNTDNYEACVSFYRNLLGLRILFQDQQEDFRLTCFECAGSYLMVETGGFGRPDGKTLEEGATKLRFNVSDIGEALQAVRAYGIEAEIVASDWGSTIDIHDPDGNRVGIRDEATFARAGDT